MYGNPVIEKVPVQNAEGVSFEGKSHVKSERRRCPTSRQSSLEAAVEVTGRVVPIGPASTTLSFRVWAFMRSSFILSWNWYILSARIL